VGQNWTLILGQLSTLIDNQLEDLTRAPLVDLSDRDIKIANAFRLPFVQNDGLVVSENLLGICNEQVKSAVRQAVMAWSWPAETGPTRAERRKEIERIDGEIARLERQLAELQAAASDAGVELR
jgi:hypothetical protein